MVINSLTGDLVDNVLNEDVVILKLLRVRRRFEDIQKGLPQVLRPAIAELDKYRLPSCTLRWGECVGCGIDR